MPYFRSPTIEVADAGQVDADLVLPPRQQIHLQQREILRLFEHPIGRVRQLPLGPVGGRVHDVGRILGQVGGDCVGRLLASAMDDGQVPLIDLVPLALQTMFRQFAASEDQHARCLAVQAVDDEDPVPRPRVSLANVVRKERIGRARTIAFRFPWSAGRTACRPPGCRGPRRGSTGRRAETWCRTGIVCP